MIRIRRAIAPLVAMAALFVAVSASAQERGAASDVVKIDATKGRVLDEGQTLRLKIDNDLIPARSMTVSVVTPTRPELVLGIVPSQSTREFQIDTRLIAGGFRLVAMSDPRDVRVSRRIDVQSQADVSWGLGLDFVRVQRVAAGDTEDPGR